MYYKMQPTLCCSGDWWEVPPLYRVTKETTRCCRHRSSLVCSKCVSHVCRMNARVTLYCLPVWGSLALTEKR